MSHPTGAPGARRPPVPGSTARPVAAGVDAAPTPGHRPLSRAEAWLLAPAPAARLAMLRVLVGAYATVWALARLPAHVAHTGQPAERWQPVGVLAPLGAPPPDAVVVGAALTAPVLALLVALGWRHRVVTPAAAVVVLGLATLDSSWGQVFHTENLMVLHLGILALAPAAADALAVGRRADGAGAAPAPDARYGWPLRLAALVVVLTYLVTGLAKVRMGGLDWVDGDTLRHIVAHDNLRKALLGDAHSPVGPALVAHAWLFAPLAVATLVVELGAWVALLGGRWRTAWVVTAWIFHAGVLALMAIVFAYPLSGVAFAPFFRLERLRPSARPGRRRPPAARRPCWGRARRARAGG